VAEDYRSFELLADEPPEAPPPEGTADAETIRFMSAEAFCAAYVAIAYVVEPLIRSSSLYTLTAKTGAGKTAFLIVMALAVATGRGELIGRTVKKGRVAFVSAENPDDVNEHSIGTPDFHRIGTPL
jgi:hypothetical protein